MPCSDQDFEYFRRLVQTCSSNIVDGSYKNLLELRLQPLMQQTGAGTISAFAALLQVQPMGAMHRTVAELMTINETSFFRDINSFHALRNEILPHILEQNRHTRSLRIWSAASATGQEAYSLAMLLDESFPDIVQSWDIRILGTDYSNAVVRYAQNARYKRIEVNRGLPARLLVKYFQRHGEEWAIRPELQRLCEFRQMNLCAPLPPMPEFDLVLLRNVLIYFGPQDRTRLLTNIRQVMAPHATLMLGNAEQACGVEHLFDAAFVGGTYYYRAGRAPAML
jgi:chemotaxis protein methyltransferase CheR